MHAQTGMATKRMEVCIGCQMYGFLRTCFRKINSLLRLCSVLGIFVHFYSGFVSPVMYMMLLVSRQDSGIQWIKMPGASASGY